MNVNKVDLADLPLEKLADKVAGSRIKELAPLVQKWAQEHRGVPLARLVDEGLRLALKPYAGKRHAQLVAKEGEVAA